MKRYVDTYNAIVGFHQYPNAPEFCSYLSARHRHTFIMRCRFEVVHNERQIEINQRQEDIRGLIESKFGYPAEFGDMSCESIAEYLINETGASAVQVAEDNYGGATLTR